MKALLIVRNVTMALAGFLITSAASAGIVKEDPKTVSVDFKFLGTFRSKPVFELNFTNASVEKDYLLQIRDVYGNVLYKETIGSNTLNKKFMLNTDEIEDDILRVEISSRKNNHTVVYEINRGVHTVQNVSINKVN